MPADHETASLQALFYAPWAATLLGADAAESIAGGGETQLFLLARGLAKRGLRVGMIVIGDAEGMPSSVDGVRIVAQAPRRRRSGAAARVSLAVGALRSLLAVRTDLLIQRN